MEFRFNAIYHLLMHNDKIWTFLLRLWSRSLTPRMHLASDNVRICCVRFGSGVQTDATLLPTMLGPAVHVVGRIQPIHVRLWRPCVMCVIGPNNVGRATVLCFGNHVWNERNVGSCWLKSLTVFKLCTTTPNNTQLQHTTSCKRVHKRTQHV